MLSFSSIVILGNFNPAIFHPEWFDRYKILPRQETQWAEGENREITEIPYKGTSLKIQEAPPPFSVLYDQAFLTFPSLTIDVILERYSCSSIKKESFSLIKEATIKVFNILKHTPIKAVGINVEGHWKYKDNAHELLRKLFAKRDDSFKKVFGDDYNIGGTISFQRKDRQIRLMIKRSTLLDNGIHFNINFNNNIEPHQAELAVDTIRTNYDKDLENSTKFLKDLIGEPETWIHPE